MSTTEGYNEAIPAAVDVTAEASSPDTDTSFSSIKSSFSLSESLHEVHEDAETTLDEFTRNFCVKDIYSIFSEYTNLIRGSSIDEQQLMFDNKDYAHLNRYLDVPCIKSTRVVVKHPSGTHDYIHANYVNGYMEKHKFILTQAPVIVALEHFWKMVWDEKVVILVSLTQIDGFRCPDYFPVDAAQSMTFGSFIVTHAGTRHVRDCYDATLLLLQKDREASSRTLLHLTFYRWPDKGTPTSPTEVLNFIEDMNHNRKLLMGQALKDGWLESELKPAPILVHCVAGVGRSGALAVLDICQRKLDASSKMPIGPVLNVQEVVQCVRMHRALAVQKPEQYLFLHFAMIEYALRKHYYKTIDYLDFSNYLQIESKE